MPSFKKLFLPFFCFLLCINASSSLSFELGKKIEYTLVEKGVPFMAIHSWLNLLSCLFFAALVLLLKKIRFDTLFKTILISIALIFPISLYLLSSSPLSYFLTSLFCYPVLSFLGWAYINQIAQVDEGKKHYFLLLSLSTVVFTIFAIPLNVISHSGYAFSSSFLLIATWSFLALTWICTYWIKKKSPERIACQKALITFPKSWPQLILFSVILIAFKLILSIKGPLFGSYIEHAAASSSSEYHSFLGKHALFSGIGILAIFILAPLLGPRLLRNKEWGFCMFILPLIGFFAILAPQISSSPFSYTLEQTLLKGLDYSWMFPLVQIAFLSFPVKERFLTQAWVFLAVSPLLEWSWKWLQLDASGILSVSFVILACMAVSIWALGKQKYQISSSTSDLLPK